MFIVEGCALLTETEGVVAHERGVAIPRPELFTLPLRSSGRRARRARPEGARSKSLILPPLPRRRLLGISPASGKGEKAPLSCSSLDVLPSALP